MKRVKLASLKITAGTISSNWIAQLRKMRLSKAHKIENPEQSAGLVPDVDLHEDTESAKDFLPSGTEETIANAVGNFFWPRPSAATYERYRNQFSF